MPLRILAVIMSSPNCAHRIELFTTRRASFFSINFHPNTFSLAARNSAHDFRRKITSDFGDSVVSLYLLYKWRFFDTVIHFLTDYKFFTQPAVFIGPGWNARFATTFVTLLVSTMRVVIVGIYLGWLLLLDGRYLGHEYTWKCSLWLPNCGLPLYIASRWGNKLTT